MLESASFWVILDNFDIFFHDSTAPQQFFDAPDPTTHSISLQANKKEVNTQKEYRISRINGKVSLKSPA